VTLFALPLAELAWTAPGSAITSVPGIPGAFVDLTADLSYAPGPGPGVAELDNQLAPGRDRTYRTRLDQLSQRNQSVGILLDHGHDSDDALAELDRLAQQSQITSEAAARRLVDSAVRPLKGRPTLEQADGQEHGVASSVVD
jgi:hypothetical protein